MGVPQTFPGPQKQPYRRCRKARSATRNCASQYARTARAADGQKWSASAAASRWWARLPSRFSLRMSRRSAATGPPPVLDLTA